MSITDAEIAELSDRGYVQLLRRTVVLTDSQIKGLSNGVPVAIIPAAGAGKAIMPLTAVYRSTIHANYTNIGDRASIGFNPLALVCDDPIDNRQEFSQLLANAGSYTWMLSVGQGSIPNDDQGGFGAYGIGGGAITPGPDPFVNAPINIILFNGDGAEFDDHGLLTGGDPANTLQVTVVYLIVDVS